MLFIWIYLTYFKHFLTNFEDETLILYNRTNYKNNDNYDWNKSKIYSIPDNNLNILDKTNEKYEYDNKSYLLQLKKNFNITNSNKLLIVNNIPWSKWIYPDDIKNKNKMYNEYIHSLKYINNNMKLNGKIIEHRFNRYKINTVNKDELLIDIDILYYRKNKIHAKHLNFLIIINNIEINAIYIKILGIVPQDNLELLNGIDTSSNNFSDFNVKSLLGEKNIENNDTIFTSTDEYTETELENVLYNILTNEDEVDYKSILNKLNDNDREHYQYIIEQIQKNKLTKINMQRKCLDLDKNLKYSDNYKKFPYNNDFIIQ